MSFAAGTRLGPYEVVSHLGTGGMGEVYRARDTRLDRTVAIKVLPTQTAQDARRLERFRQEARAVSRLSHPHICALHDVGEQDGTFFLVMEHVQGRTLAERLEEGPLPLEELLRHGLQIAEALHAAHREGVVHRDLKPANVMLTREGVKLLDFGLARLKLAEEGAGAQTASVLTEEGVVLGTLPYMAPEQLEGKKSDARTDIFALGIVLYEMATSRRPFVADSRASLIATILRSEPPPLATLQPLAPPALEWAVKRCLAKDPEDRWQSAADVAAQLRWIAAGPLEESALRPRPRSGRLAWAIALVLGAVAAALGAWGLIRPVPEVARPVVRFAISLPAGQRLATDYHPAVALSPEGTRLVYSAEVGQTTQLYVRALDRLDAQPLPGTEGGVGPFFSPDGKWLGFFADRKLKKAALSGGAAVVLAEAPDAWGASWGPDDAIVFTPAGFGGLQAVPAAGGPVRVLSSPTHAEGDHEHDWPQVLPGSAHVLFTSWGGGSFEAARIMMLSLRTGERHVVVEGGFHARYVPGGYVVYARRRGLQAVPLDIGRLRAKGPPVAVLPDVLVSVAGAAQFSLSTDGALAYVPAGPGEVDRTLVWVDRTGRAAPAMEARASYLGVALSPDGSRIAASVEGDKTADVWVADTVRGSLARLTFEGGLNGYPVWAPDGQRLAFTSSRSGSMDLYWQPADGSGSAERLLADEHVKMAQSWSPDGRVLVFGQIDPQTGWDIWALLLEGRRARPILQTPYDEADAAFSPDGRFLAYASDESGRSEVYVQPYPGPGGKWQVSTGGGRQPRWGRDGRELFYRDGERLLSVPVETRHTFRAARPSTLFARHYQRSQAPRIQTYDVAPDGRLLMIKASDEPPRQVNVVLNWLDEMKSRLPPP